jgi:molybdate-binding protein
MAAAAAVQSGLADAAPGFAGAASALGLGFVPQGEEHVELVLRADFASGEAGRALQAALGDPRFRATLATRGA